jgi:hypothetical protein
VEFPYTGDQKPRISSSQNHGHYEAPSDTIGNNLRLLFAPARLRVPVDDRWWPIVLAQF